MESSTVDGALHLARLGYHIFPAQKIIKPDGTVDKPPVRGVMWSRESTTEEAIIRRWWQRWPDAVIAIDCGKSGIVVLDVDPRHGGAWEDDAPRYGTVSGGQHVLYAEPRSPIGCDNTGKVAPGVDVKGMGGYVVCWAPATVTARPTELPGLPDRVAQAMGRRPEVPAAKVTQSQPTGSEPVTQSHVSDLEKTVSDLENVLVKDAFSSTDRVFTPDQAAEYVRREAIEPLRNAKSGFRNDQLNRSAMVFGHFVPGFWTVEHATAGLTAIALGIGLNAAETAATIRSGLRAGQRDPYTLAAGTQAVSETVEPAPDAVDKLLGELLDTDGLDSIGDLEPLVKGWLARNTVARINGKSTHGKSFVALDLAAHVGTGRDWRGHRVSKGEVVYCIAEGVEGFRKRVRAWEKHYGVKMTGVKFLPRPVQVKGPEWSTFVAACKRIQPSMVVLDTQARVTVGINENDNSEMGIVVEQAETLRRETGACVMFVHHLGHNGEEGRGATAVKAAVQTELLVTRDLNMVEVSIPKQKDDTDMLQLMFGMHVIELWKDEDGDDVTSCVLIEPGTHFAPLRQAEDMEDDSDRALKLIQVFHDTFSKGNGGTKAEVKHISKKRGMSDATFYRAWNELVERGVIGRVEGLQSWKVIPVDARGDQTTGSEQK